jgi:predicted acylesterase/phospholipase RssA
MKGIAYIGALQELERFYRFDMYAGTSAGAITAALLGAGYTVDELRKIMLETDFSTFIPERLRQFTNFLFYGGLHRGLELTLWLDGLLASKLDSVNQVLLGQLPIPVVLYACRRDADAIIFDSTNRKNTPVSYAVRCSMSIPLFFTPEKSEGLNVFDGGMRNNYPVQALLKKYPGKKFIGLYLGDEVYVPRPPSVLRDLINIAFEATDVESVNLHKNSTIIIDPSPVSTVDFKLSREEKEFLLSQGRAAARKFLKAHRLISDDEYNEAKTAATEAKKRALEVRLRRSRGRTTKRIAVFLIGGLAATFAWTLSSPWPPGLGSFVHRPNPSENPITAPPRDTSDRPQPPPAPSQPQSPEIPPSRPPQPSVEPDQPRDPLRMFVGAWISVNPPGLQVVFTSGGLGQREVLLPALGQAAVRVSDGRSGSNILIAGVGFDCYYNVSPISPRKMVWEFTAGPAVCPRLNVLEKEPP